MHCYFGSRMSVIKLLLYITGIHLLYCITILYLPSAFICICYIYNTIYCFVYYHLYALFQCCDTLHYLYPPHSLPSLKPHFRIFKIPLKPHPGYIYIYIYIYMYIYIYTHMLLCIVYTYNIYISAYLYIYIHRLQAKLQDLQDPFVFI